jgi:hypothetical protein
MKKALSALLLITAASAAPAEDGEGFVMGAGQWTCAKVLEVEESGSDIDVGVLVGWVLGYWSAATFEREPAFDDIVEAYGGRAIYDAMLEECRKAPDTQLYFLTQAMIENTK